MRKQKITIAVIGGSEIDDKMEQIARKIGYIVGEMDCILVCGGLFGSMEAASRGCKEAGGMTIGLLPGKDKEDANPFIDIALPTTIGFARNAMVAASGDIVIALAGSHGTSSEISYALVYKRPVIDMGGWNRGEMIQVNGLDGLKNKLKELIQQIHDQ